MHMYIKRNGISLSVLFNTSLGGYSNQTFSARNYGWKRDGKVNAVWLIDMLAIIFGFFINLLCNTKTDYTNHCMESWVFWRIRKDVMYDIECEKIKEGSQNGKSKRWKIEGVCFGWGSLKRFKSNKDRHKK